VDHRTGGPGADGRGPHPPTLTGALAGIPIGLLLYLPLDHQETVMPPGWWFLASVLIPLVATAALTAVPARTAARRSIAETLSAERT
jgi:putative ABC transport system permease protein